MSKTQKSGYPLNVHRNKMTFRKTHKFFKSAMEKVKINSKTLMEMNIICLILAAAPSDVIAFH